MSEPPPLRGTFFQRKEEDMRMSLSLYRHFSAVIGQAKQGKAYHTLVIAGEIASVR